MIFMNLSIVSMGLIPAVNIVSAAHAVGCSLAMKKTMAVILKRGKKQPPRGTGEHERRAHSLDAERPRDGDYKKLRKG